MTTLIAHRGASIEAPENTLAAFKRAIELAVDCIEMDVRLTKDKVPIILHDSTLCRTTNAKHHTRVEQMSLDEIRRFDAGSWFHSKFSTEKIPTLEEVLSLDRKRVKLMLEIKKGVIDSAVLTKTILQMLPKNDPSLFVGSFELDIACLIKKEGHYQTIGIIEKQEMIQPFLNQGLKHIAIWKKILEPRLIKTLHESEITVWVFTVDDTKSAIFLRSINADGIISNDPLTIGASLRG